MTTEAVQTDWVPSAAAFAARLALIRNKLGWNVKEAATSCDLPPQSWRNWEDGTRPQDYAQVCQRIATRTGVSLTWLAWGPEEGGGSFA